ncbi:MAG TPA: tetratricopeptide repeat protein [Candidatus Acidoferrales bacterium]|jgi:tetratricopeptide (TPR) repeat protein|nr:tetratricopeptide repeat protein [Candidatus Acidoferrales bacterium]
MRARTQRSLLLILLLNLLVSLPPAVAQQKGDAAELAKRHRAMALFGEGKRLEALPLLEELAEKNPQDSEILVALAASLIDHAATLSDAEAAAKERFRARDLVQRAWTLGNPSPLAENLRELLEELPASGAIKFSDNAAVQQAMIAGEAAFARRDFDEALKDYGKALELEPGNYPAALFTGNAYDRKNDVGKAAEWYERAIQINPNVETAYRYYADMLAKKGEMDKARTLLIRAAVAEPYNKIVWREIRAWATINNTAFHVVYVGVPRLPKDDATRSARQSMDVAAAWRAYYAVRTEWQKGGKFEKEFPREAEYRHSLAEESEALSAAAKILEELKRDKKTAELLAADAAASLLLKLHEAGLIDAYVLFSLGDEGIAKDYIAYRAKSRGKLEEYMDKFVVPPAPAKQ